MAARWRGHSCAVLTYYGELTRAMNLLAEHERSIFIGQAVAYPGTGMTASFKHVPREKLLELPVFENTQVGMSIGLALGGMLPISVFPRWNFLVEAAGQLINHLDKIPLYSEYRPKVIIRVAVPNPVPLDPGPQHVGDFSEAFKLMFKTMRVVKLERADLIMQAYEDAMDRDVSTVLVEYAERYSDG